MTTRAEARQRALAAQTSGEGVLLDPTFVLELLDDKVYRPNGDAGDAYEAQYCSRCVHHDASGEGPGCAVMNVHVLFAYEECDSKSNAEKILNELIPQRGVRALKCSMFIDADELVRRRRARAAGKAAGNLPGVE